ncbi:Myocardin-related transcription factor B [Oryzias melastigma]|uniref:Myocardin-related transcription factor B n=1 Tax=Oryzias melastigma TaxID=30732 RepID=A0A834F2H4_ORYME|nr:Myocardin-related transcription factor B [Oryzias melastigma]
MLKNLQCVCLDPAPFRSQPIRRNMEERAIRFELERQACQSLRKVLQLKLQQRRTREELATQGMMPPLKSSAAFHKQTGSLERAWTDEDLKRKIKSKSELDRRQILEETSAEPSFPAMQLKRARLTDDLSEKATRRPRPMELIHRNIIPVQPRTKQASADFPKSSRESSSGDEHSNDSLSPGQAVSQECPLSSGLVHSPTEDLSRSSIPSPTQMPPSGLHFPPICGSFNSVKMASRALDSSSLMGGSNAHIKPKLNSDRLCQKNKKTKDNKPKIKKLKYHQYIPPDRKGDKESPPHLDSSYAKILQQQQLYLQLQILSQQQNHNYHTILPAPPTRDQKQSSSSSTTSSSSPQSTAPPSTDLPHQQSHICLSSLAEIKAVSANPNLDDMKVTELRSELKLRSLPISGTKNNLIERLRSYQEQNQGCDFTSSPTAEGTKGLELEDAPESSKTAATAGDRSSQELQFQQLETSSFSADAGKGVSPASSPEQLMRRGDHINPLPPPLNSPSSKSPKYISLNSDPLGQLSCSPTEFNLQPSSVARRPANIKKEPPCSTRTPCQFSLKSVSLQKHRLPASPATSAAAPLVTADKDRMLQEKDKQIAELTRMLKQKQKLVEVLRMQLELESRGAPEPRVFLKVKEEPPDNSCASPQISPELDSTRITIKQEAVEVDIGGASVGPPRRPPSPPAAEKIKDWVHLSLRPDQRIPQKKPPALQLAQQQQAIHRCVHGTQQKPKNPQKLQMRQREQQKQQHSEHLQPRPPKQQDKPKQQRSLLQRQFKEKQTKQLQEIQMHGKQQKCPKNLNLQNNSTPDGKHFLIPPNGHINTDQSRNDGRRAAKSIPLQAQKGAAQASVHQPEQEGCSGAPSSLQPFFTDQDPALRRRNPATPAFQIDLCGDLDVLLSPVSPASVKTASSLLDDNDQEKEGDIIDIILQAGEMSFRPAPDPSLDSLHPASFSSLSPAPSIRPSPDPSKPGASLQPELQEEKLHLSTSGRLEDFLESTTGKPLLGVEPGGVITLIDDLHSQLLCTPSILDHPPSPMDTLDAVGGWGFDNKDWLDFSTGGDRDEDTPTLAPLGPPTPVSVFSTDFLDSSDLHLHWDSCL